MDATSKNALKNTNTPQNKSTGSEQNRSNTIYMSIDHLKKGRYSLNILEKEKVIKSIKINKQ